VSELNENLDTDAQAQAGVASETDTDTDPATSELAQKLAETEEKLAYLAADFENYKRASFRRLEEERVRAARQVIEQLLPAIDNFGLALQHAGTAKDVASLKVGLDFIAQQLEAGLKGAGLEPIEAQGKTFDPALHDAIEEVEAEDGAASGSVASEVQRGYTFSGQVLRPSRVRVVK
jgi:molecular chaperone GrpE